MALLEWVAAVAMISNDSGGGKRRVTLRQADWNNNGSLEFKAFPTYFLHLVGRSRPQAASSDSLWAASRSEGLSARARACDAEVSGSRRPLDSAQI